MTTFSVSVDALLSGDRPLILDGGLATELEAQAGLVSLGLTGPEAQALIVESVNLAITARHEFLLSHPSVDTRPRWRPALVPTARRWMTDRNTPGTTGC